MQAAWCTDYVREVIWPSSKNCHLDEAKTYSFGAANKHMGPLRFTQATSLDKASRKLRSLPLTVTPAILLILLINKRISHPGNIVADYARSGSCAAFSR